MQLRLLFYPTLLYLIVNFAASYFTDDTLAKCGTDLISLVCIYRRQATIIMIKVAIVKFYVVYG